MMGTEVREIRTFEVSFIVEMRLSKFRLGVEGRTLESRDAEEMRIVEISPTAVEVRVREVRARKSRALKAGLAVEEFRVLEANPFGEICPVEACPPRYNRLIKKSLADKGRPIEKPVEFANGDESGVKIRKAKRQSK